jgi:hypothetical protein
MRTVLKMKIGIYWSESNSWIYFYIVLNKNWKIYWCEQSFISLGPTYKVSNNIPVYISRKENLVFLDLTPVGMLWHNCEIRLL